MVDSQEADSGNPVVYRNVDLRRTLSAPSARSLRRHEHHIYWSFTTQLVKTDLDGKVLKKIPVANHHGDLCHVGGKLYAAVNLGKFNDPKGNADSWVYEYDAKDLEITRQTRNAGSLSRRRRNGRPSKDTSSSWEDCRMASRRTMSTSTTRRLPISSKNTSSKAATHCSVYRPPAFTTTAGGSVATAHRRFCW